jgi:hypothetical protein
LLQRYRFLMKALFFLRHYNDIDHITPVIGKWIDSGHAADVVLIGLESFRRDYRIAWLKSLPRVRLDHIRELLPRRLFWRWQLQTGLLVSSLRRPPIGWLLARLERVIHRECRLRAWDRCTEILLARSFAEGEGGVVAFDWVERNSSIAREWIDTVLAAARGRGLGTVSLPHGDSPHFSQLIRRQEWQPGPDATFAAARPFDRVVVPNELCAGRFRPFLADAQIAVLGSPRYCDEWLGKLKTLAPAVVLKRSNSRLKLVLFLRKRVFTSFWEEIGLVVRLIAAFEGVELLIKPHTRGGWQQWLTRDVGIRRLPNVCVADDIHSGSLIDWADVIIDVATSVSFEAVKLGKPVLAADYLHAARSTVAEYMPETELRCRDDVYLKVEHFLRHGTTGFYRPENRQRFIAEIIEAGDADVLPRYVRLLEALAGSERTMDSSARLDLEARAAKSL